MKQIENRKHVLGELQRAFDKKVSASDILDSKLQNILNYSSIIVAVFASIITSALLGKIGFFYWFGLIVVVALYIWAYICIKQGTAATTFYSPISNTEQELNEKFIDVRETSALDTSIKAYIYGMYVTNEINTRKAKMLERASNLMFWIVILLSASILFGLLFPQLTYSDIIRFIVILLSKLKP